MLISVSSNNSVLKNSKGLLYSGSIWVFLILILVDADYHKNPNRFSLSSIPFLEIMVVQFFAIRRIRYVKCSCNNNAWKMHKTVISWIEIGVLY